MSFQHKLVTQILAEAGDKSPRQNRSGDGGAPEVGALSINRHGHGTKANTPEHYEKEDRLFEFMDEISDAFRGVQFVYKFAYERWVYMPQQPYPMGYIAYGDYRANSNGSENKFVVCSHKIRNLRYADYSDPYRMRMSNKLDIATRNAKKFLSNYSPMDMANVNKVAVRQAIAKVWDELTGKARTDVQDAGLPHNTFINAGTLLNELRHLFNTGHEFLDPSYRTQLGVMFESMQQVEAHRETVNMYFVRGYKRLGEPAFDVVPIDNIESYSQSKVSDEFIRYTDDLPEDVMGRVAALSIMPDASYVDGVGYRVNESMFYVIR